MNNLNSEGLITFSKGVELLPYKPRQFIEREYLTDQELLANAGGTAFLDIELYPNYCLITFKINGKFVCLECGEGRNFNPKLLSWIMHNYRTVGFNSIKYDLLILWLAYHNQDTYTLKDASNDIIIRGIREYELKKEYKFFTFKTSHIDLIEVAPLKGSLKLYMARLHCKRIQDLPFPDTQVLTEEEKEIVKQYNFNDLDGTEELFNFMKERIELREALGIEYREDLRSKSDAQIAEVVISKEVAKLNGHKSERAEIEVGAIYKYSIPDFLKFATPQMQELLGKIRTAKFEVNINGKIISPKELEHKVELGGVHYSLGIGGLHSYDKCTGYASDDDHDIIDADVASYYPSLIINLGLYPVGMGINFLVVYKGFKTRRIDAKKFKRFTEDKGLKIFLNGVSGKWSDPFSNMYCPQNTIQMNLTGQLSILMFVEMLVCNGLKVISANTDGVTVYCHKNDRAKFQYWYDYWQKLTGFDLEAVDYKKYYARDVNAYFAVKNDGKVKVKGPWSEVGSQSGTKLDTNPNVLICTDAISELLSKGIPIEQTIKECKDFTRFVAVRQVKGGAHKNREYLGKVVRWAYIKGETGTINYVVTGNKVPDTDGAVPFMDLPNEWPDINYDWYINKCREILEEIGYSPKARQLQFF